MDSDRSPLQTSLLLATLGWGVGVASALLLSLFLWTRPWLVYVGILPAALAVHAGLYFAVTEHPNADEPDSRKRWAIVANAVPVVLFWLFVKLIFRTLREF